MPYNFDRFDRRSARRLLSVPELTIQSAGSISMNAAAYELMGSPKAIELGYDEDQKVIGLLGVPEETPHAYPIRPVGKEAQTYVMSPKAFFAFYNIPLGQPVRREVKFEDGYLIVDLNDPGRIATSNRNIAKVRAAENGHVESNGNGTPSVPDMHSSGANPDE